MTQNKDIWIICYNCKNEYNHNDNKIRDYSILSKCPYCSCKNVITYVEKDG